MKKNIEENEKKNGLERDDMMKNFFSFFIDGEMYSRSYLGKKNI